MKIYAKEFCEIFGVKSDTLRFFVDKKLIEPETNPVNRYKIYSEKEMMDYLYLSKCRDINVPLNDVAFTLVHKNNLEQIDYLNALETKLIEEMDEISRMLMMCRRFQRDVNLSLDSSDVTVRKNKQINVYEFYLIEDGAINHKVCDYVNQEFNNKNQLLYGISVKKEYLLDETLEEYPVSLTASFPDLKNTQEVENYSYCYKDSDCISMILKTKEPIKITRKDLQPVFEYVKKNHLRITDGLTSWIINKTREDGIDYYYFSIRISVKS